MQYEIVNMKEKTVAGFAARTNNSSADMRKTLCGLWKRFYSSEGAALNAHKTNNKTLGIYTDYSSDENGDYTAMAACEVDGINIPEGFETRKIPSGKYAKFIVKGNMTRAVQEFWISLWNMRLPRSFLFDFEEYQNSDCENAEIHIYISLK